MYLSNIDGAQRQIYKSGSVVITQGEKTDYVYYLSKGICARKRLLENGTEIVDGLRRSSETIDSVIGILTVIDGFDKYPSSFTALTDCVCYKIPKQNFLDYLNSHIEVLYDIIRFASHEYRDLHKKYLSHSMNSISTYICNMIFELSEVQPSGKRILSSKYSNEFLSKIGGITPVTTARIMSFLKDNEIVQRTKHGLLIADENALNEYRNGKKMKYKK